MANSAEGGTAFSSSGASISSRTPATETAFSRASVSGLDEGSQEYTFRKIVDLCE